MVISIVVGVAPSPTAKQSYGSVCRMHLCMSKIRAVKNSPKVLTSYLTYWIQNSKASHVSPPPPSTHVENVEEILGVSIVVTSTRGQWLHVVRIAVPHPTA